MNQSYLYSHLKILLIGIKSGQNIKNQPIFIGHACKSGFNITIMEFECKELLKP